MCGCASSGPTGREVLTGSIVPQKSRLVLYRSNSPLGAAIQPSYIVDGKSVASSTPNGFVVCDLNPGTHAVSVANTELTVNLGGGNDKARVTLQPGQTVYYKAEPQVGLTVGVVTLSQVTESQGRTDTADLHKLEGTCA